MNSKNLKNSKPEVEKDSTNELMGLDIDKLSSEQLEEILKQSAEKLDATAYYESTQKDLPSWIHFT